MTDTPGPGPQPPGGYPPPPSSAYPDIIRPSQPPKDPIAALLFNLFFVCVGYFFIGQWQKGIAGAVGLALEISAIFGVAVVTLGCGYCVMLPLSFALHAAMAADCYMQAQALQVGNAIGQWTFFNQHLGPAGPAPSAPPPPPPYQT